MARMANSAWLSWLGSSWAVGRPCKHSNIMFLSNIRFSLGHAIRLAAYGASSQQREQLAVLTLVQNAEVTIAVQRRKSGLESILDSVWGQSCTLHPVWGSGGVACCSISSSLATAVGSGSVGASQHMVSRSSGIGASSSVCSSLFRGQNGNGSETVPGCGTSSSSGSSTSSTASSNRILHFGNHSNYCSSSCVPSMGVAACQLPTFHASLLGGGAAATLVKRAHSVAIAQHVSKARVSSQARMFASHNTWASSQPWAGRLHRDPVAAEGRHRLHQTRATSSGTRLPESSFSETFDAEDEYLQSVVDAEYEQDSTLRSPAHGCLEQVPAVQVLVDVLGQVNDRL